MQFLASAQNFRGSAEPRPLTRPSRAPVFRACINKKVAQRRHLVQSLLDALSQWMDQLSTSRCLPTLYCAIQ